MPNDWTRAVIVLWCRGKGGEDECTSYSRGITLQSIPGKVCGSFFFSEGERDKSAGRVKRRGVLGNMKDVQTNLLWEMVRKN